MIITFYEYIDDYNIFYVDDYYILWILMIILSG